MKEYLKEIENYVNSLRIINYSSFSKFDNEELINKTYYIIIISKWDKEEIIKQYTLRKWGKKINELFK